MAAQAPFCAILRASACMHLRARARLRMRASGCDRVRGRVHNVSVSASVGARAPDSDPARAGGRMGGRGPRRRRVPTLGQADRERARAGILRGCGTRTAMGVPAARPWRRWTGSAPAASAQAPPAARAAPPRSAAAPRRQRFGTLWGVQCARRTKEYSGWGRKASVGKGVEFVGG